MRETERYLNRATRGLWGAARRDARLELRGAVEDRTYRHQLLGLNETDATHAALRDLGNPHAIARDLSRVHSLPHAARAALLASVAALLGVQALAQVPTVRAIPERRAGDCEAIRTAKPAQMTAQERAAYNTFMTARGGLDGALTWCRQAAASHSDLLRLDDIVAALRAGGVNARLLNRHLTLQFPGQPGTQSLSLNANWKTVEGQTYISKLSLPLNLRMNLPGEVPLRLEGLVNPVLQIGPSKLQLGTQANPVLVTDLYAVLLMEDLQNWLAADIPSTLTSKISATLSSPLNEYPAHTLSLNAPDDALYLTLGNERQTRPDGGSDCRCHGFDLNVSPVRQGKVTVPILTLDRSETSPRIVSTPAELFRSTERKEAALLVYRLDPGDLRNLKLTPVPAAQLKIHTAP